jgi:hypothetical protein
MGVVHPEGHNRVPEHVGVAEHWLWLVETEMGIAEVGIAWALRTEGVEIAGHMNHHLLVDHVGYSHYALSADLALLAEQVAC